MIFSKKQLLFFLLLTACCYYGCEQGREKKVVRDTTITKATAFNDLFLDSTQLENFIRSDSEFNQYREPFFDFYKSRNYQYAWFDSTGLAEQANNFMNLLDITIAQLDDSSLYNKKLNQLYVRVQADSAKHKRSLQTELYLTGQFFEYASKVYKGSDIDATELGWYIPRRKYNLTALLDSAIGTAIKKQTLYLPLNRQFNTLREAIAKYNQIKKKDTWDSIAVPSKPYKSGDTSQAITLIKHRLFLLGDYADNDSSNVYDSSFAAAVKSYQHRLGLVEDGALGVNTMKELNIPITERIKSLLINLERIRWMPAENDSSFILVNIPEFKLHVFDSGQQKFQMRIIVGKEGTSTVIFTGDLKYIVFSPYWNVPESIVRKEIVPGMKRGVNYIQKHNMEITGNANGLPLVRQKPGNDNALGNVKFLFPNEFNIYLHDTPNRDLFSQNNRMFSHGCIRIQEPQKLAEYLLRNNPQYTPEIIDSLMHLGKEKWVTLNHPVRVYLGYFTAWVDVDGKVNFRKDIYGHDQKMAAKLFD